MKFSFSMIFAAAAMFAKYTSASPVPQDDDDSGSLTGSLLGAVTGLEGLVPALPALPGL